jgi:hypothetical protein
MKLYAVVCQTPEEGGGFHEKVGLVPHEDSSEALTMKQDFEASGQGRVATVYELTKVEVTP